jgi:hypothetical protein
MDTSFDSNTSDFVLPETTETETDDFNDLELPDIQEMVGFLGYPEGGAFGGDSEPWKALFSDELNQSDNPLFVPDDISPPSLTEKEAVDVLNQMRQDATKLGKGMLGGGGAEATGRSQLSLEQTGVLTEWFVAHAKQPPHQEDKKMLAWQTGLEPRTVGDWMANTRRRVLTRAKQGIDPQNLLEYRIALVIAREEEKAAYALDYAQ